MQIFYNGLDFELRAAIDSAAGVTLINMEMQASFKFLEDLADNQ